MNNFTRPFIIRQGWHAMECDELNVSRILDSEQLTWVFDQHPETSIDLLVMQLKESVSWVNQKFGLTCNSTTVQFHTFWKFQSPQWHTSVIIKIMRRTLLFSIFSQLPKESNHSLYPNMKSCAEKKASRFVKNQKSVFAVINRWVVTIFHWKFVGQTVVTVRPTLKLHKSLQKQDRNS